MGNERNFTIELAAASDAKALAALHDTILPRSRLSLFGQGYLTDCYHYFVDSRDELVFVARSDESVVGGAFASLAPGSLSRRLVTHTRFLLQFAMRPLGSGARQIVADLLQPAPPATLPDQPELVAIFVAPEQQGRGIGEMICRAVEAELIRRQFKSYVVHTERDPGNRAVAFYRRLGFMAAEPTMDSHHLMLLSKTLP
jgi:ribosomal protein S18 acetylase RimI-like enzyme